MNSSISARRLTWRASLTSDQERRCSITHQRRSSQSVLRRSVESAANCGHRTESRVLSSACLSTLLRERLDLAEFPPQGSNLAGERRSKIAADPWRFEAIKRRPLQRSLSRLSPLPGNPHAQTAGIVWAFAGSGERDVTAADAGVALGPVGEVPFEKAPQRYSLAEVKSQAGLNPRHVLRRRGSVNQERRGRGPGQK